MARDIDIVIQSAGGKNFQPFFSPEIDASGYERVKKGRNLTRTLITIGCGAGSDPGPDRDQLLGKIDEATGNSNSRLGAICLFGTSNGCGLILALAKALQKRSGTPKTLYIGLGNVTMMPFGRDPGVPGIGNLQPQNLPQVSLGLSANPIAGLRSRLGSFPSAKDLPPPRIADPGVDAQIRKNFFEVQGNRVKVFTLSPAGRDNWWWTSDMTFGEVHGEIPGWNNIPKTTTATSDFNHHVELCEKIAIPEMKHDIALELINFVTNL
jgi:hypothetical protein